MAKYLIASLALAALVSADDGGAGAYAAPTGGYAPPATGGYAPPADNGGYGAPAATYDQTYDAPSTGYGEQVSYEQADVAGGDLFDLSKLAELLPLFLAVFAAIIVAQLVGPLIAMLFGAKVGLVGPLLAPFGMISSDLINIILLPFSLQLCTTGNPPVAVGTPAGRSMLNADTVDILANLVYKSLEAYN